MFETIGALCGWAVGRIVRFVYAGVEYDDRRSPVPRGGGGCCLNVARCRCLCVSAAQCTATVDVNGGHGLPTATNGRCPHGSYGLEACGGDERAQHGGLGLAGW